MVFETKNHQKSQKDHLGTKPQKRSKNGLGATFFGVSFWGHFLTYFLIFPTPIFCWFFARLSEGVFDEKGRARVSIWRASDLLFFINVVKSRKAKTSISLERCHENHASETSLFTVFLSFSKDVSQTSFFLRSFRKFHDFSHFWGALGSQISIKWRKKKLTIFWSKKSGRVWNWYTLGANPCQDTCSTRGELFL